MKKTLTMLLSVAMLALSCLTFAEGIGPEERLTENLVNQLAVFERMFGDMLWFADYAERFDMTRQWKDLQRARAALSATLTELQQTEAPALSLTEEDVDALLERGVDASFVIQLEKDIATERDELIQCCVGLLYGFWYSVPLADEWKDHTMACVRHERRYADLFLEYNALSVDQLTSQIADEAWIEEIDARLEERCPMTSARRLRGNFSTKEIEAFADSYNDDLKDLKSEMATIVGVNQFGEYRAEDVYESGDMREYVNNRLDIGGLPPLLPDFFWNDPIDPEYDLMNVAMLEWKKALVQDFIFFGRRKMTKYRSFTRWIPCTRLRTAM